MPGPRYAVVDAFTDGGRPFSGNPAAVVLLDVSDAWPADAWLQSVAAQMNLSETAFLLPEVGGYALRWCTPACEVDLCGHATLAAAAALAELGHLADGRAVSFSTRSGTLTAARHGDRFALDFPTLPPASADAPPGLLESLGVEATYVGRAAGDYLVEVGSEAAVRACAPDFRRLGAVECRGVIVAARSDSPGFDFASRFFGPAVGIDEDPVTGSAHCALAPYWAAKLGKASMVGRQLSPRGGAVAVELKGDRVILGGAAAVFASGELAGGPA